MRTINQHLDALTNDYNLIEINLNEDLTYMLNWFTDMRIKVGGNTVLPNDIEMNKLIKKYL